MEHTHKHQHQQPIIKPTTLTRKTTTPNTPKQTNKQLPTRNKLKSNKPTIIVNTNYSTQPNSYTKPTTASNIYSKHKISEQHYYQTIKPTTIN